MTFEDDDVGPERNHCGTQRKDVAETVDEINEYVIADLEKARQIRELNAKKAELEEEIQRLKETYRQ